jgi:hypothetical protein
LFDFVGKSAERLADIRKTTHIVREQARWRRIVGHPLNINPSQRRFFPAIPLCSIRFDKVTAI